MIHMPRRSVTRFFIPLIDVLILLFCIFLLMEFHSESEVDRQTEAIAEQSELIGQLQSSSSEKEQSLKDLLKLNPDLKEMARQKKEIEDLKKAAQRDLKDAWEIRTIDIKADDGSISHYEKGQVTQIVNEDIARKLIKDHQKLANGRKLYYLFVYARGQQTFMETEQRQRYHKWFKRPDVSNSLPPG